jgi:hypothetical protein
MLNKMQDTLNHLAEVGVGVTVGGAVVPPVESTTQILHLVIGIITSVIYLVNIIKKPKQKPQN